MNRINIKSRVVIVQIINKVIIFKKSLKPIYSKYLNDSQFSDMDKRFIIEVSRGVIRMLKKIDYEIDYYYNGKIKSLEKFYLIILRVAIYQLKYMDRVPDYAVVSTSVEITKLFFPKYSKLTNGLLRNVCRGDFQFEPPTQNSSNEYFSIYYSHPEWLIDKWSKIYNYSSLISLLEFNNKAPEVWFRYNENNIDILDVKEKLDSKENLVVHEYLKNFFTIKKSSIILNSNLFKKGNITVQSPVNGLIVKLLNPLRHETIIDVCAAPGGKTLNIFETMKQTGHIIAYDINAERIKSIIHNLNIRKIKNVKVEVKDATKDELDISSKIIVDVPCSGTGTMSKNADLRWRKNIEDINELSILQENILNNSSQYLMPNGVIVYSTCSIEEEENWMVVDKFLSKNSNYTIDHAKNYINDKFTDSRGALNINPYKHNMEGGFAVRLVNNES